ncbi:MAG TPA: mechanosensitive ion channel family protein [Candidatus Acidoferrales bacterium]|nr:mechanosensitive ion channel family protein [Candidatus Acidoferrales bacterium]
MRSLRYLLIPVIAAVICSTACVSAGAQIVPQLAPTPTPRASLFATAPVVIDGAVVLRVTALASPPPGAMPIESRLFLIDGAIAQLLAVDPENNETIYSPASLKIGIDQEGNEYALVATDDRHRSPLPVLTVTEDDARRNGTTPKELATQWQAMLQQAVRQALERRQPEEIHRSLSLIAYGAAALLVLTIAGLAATIARRGKGLAAFIPWILALAWAAAITYALLLFPQTVRFGQSILRAGVRVVAIWAVAIVVDRVLAIAIRQAVKAWASIGAPSSQQARALLRVPTMSRALAGFERVIVYFIAALLTLSALNIPIASVVTIGGIAALAIGFAAQSLVRDFLNGLLVLFEDQYVVGDYIMIGEFNGIVEHLTLRVVQIRDSKGNLITIPHSSVTQVVNSSRNWSRIDYQIAVDAATDLRKAIETLRSTLESLSEDETWRDAVIDPVEWIGVESISRGGVVLRCVIRTEPLRQFELRREINLRVAAAFAKAGISLGYDASTTLVTPPAASPDPT